MLNTDREEQFYVDQFEDRIATKWIFDLDFIDLYEMDFFVDNRKYIQKDKYLKYNLFKRLNLWTQVSEQLVDYDITLTKSIRKLDSVIKLKDDEITIIWWWF